LKIKPGFKFNYSRVLFLRQANNLKAVLGLSLALLVLLNSCYDEMPNNPIPNKAPVTKIFLKPDSGISNQPSKINLHWSGDDPDGLVIGYYFSFDGVNWTFTTKNDSSFELKIGAVDTTFNFLVSAVDNSGNEKYDSQVFQNNINFGAEPFVDKNGNGIWDIGEDYTDIGIIDPNPAKIILPIRNSAPIISWNVLSTIPAVSYPAMTFGWDIFDLDGNETITNIKIALNDTNNAVLLNGGVRIITIRTNDFTNPNPLMDIYIDGNPNGMAPVKLPGLIFDSNNRFYVQAEDISGAKSSWISLPDTSRNWFVKKPKGKVLIVDDYILLDDAAQFYSSMMDSLSLTNKFDILDLNINKLPYLNTTFLETIKLYDNIIWYTDNDPSLNLANAAVQNYLDAGGKIFFSMQFPNDIDLQLIEGFLPIESDTSYYKSSIGINTSIASRDSLNYPNLLTNRSFSRVRSFKLKDVGVKPLYYFPSGVLNGHIGFESSSKNLFFIGGPLQRLDGNPGSIKKLLFQVLFQDFNLTL
jgi:hypothetical protein